MSFDLHHDAENIMMLLMRTTVDIPEGLLRRVRAQAALDGRKMKDVVNEALRRHLGMVGDGEDGGGDRALPETVRMVRAGRFRLPVVGSSRAGEVTVSPERLRELEAAEDAQRHGTIFGR